jgi:hypothetical protein
LVRRLSLRGVCDNSQRCVCELVLHPPDPRMGEYVSMSQIVGVASNRPTWSASLNRSRTKSLQSMATESAKASDRVCRSHVRSSLRTEERSLPQVREQIAARHLLSRFLLLTRQQGCLRYAVNAQGKRRKLYQKMPTSSLRPRANYRHDNPPSRRSH